VFSEPTVYILSTPNVLAYRMLYHSHIHVCHLILVQSREAQGYIPVIRYAKDYDWSYNKMEAGE
jgi:hypothetical protein